MLRLGTGGWIDKTRPPTAFRLNRRSPLANGLVLWLPLSDQSLVDRIRKTRFVPNGASIFVPTEKGWVHEFDDALTQNITAWSAPITATPLTLAAWAWTDNADLQQRILAITDDAGSYCSISFNGNLSNDPVRAHQAGTATYSAQSIVPPGYSTNTWHHVCGTFVGTANRAVYLDGGAKGTSVDDCGAQNPFDAVHIGKYEYGLFLSGRVSNACIWDRALSDAEVYYLYTHPYELYEPYEPRFWSPPARTTHKTVIPIGTQSWKRGHPVNTAFELNRDTPLADGLVFWLPFSDQQLIDRMRGLNLTKYNSPIFIPSERGWAMSFSSVSAKYLRASSTVVTAAPLSMSCWIYPTVDSVGAILGIGNSGASSNTHSWLIWRESTFDRISLMRSDDVNNYAYTSNSSCSVNTWYLATAVEVSSTLGSIFINGGDKGINTDSVVPSGINNISFGRQANAGTNYYNGYIMNACIWNRALSDAEVYELYKNPWILYKPYTPQFWSLPTKAPEPEKKYTAIPIGIKTWKRGHAPNTQFELNRDSSLADGLVFWMPFTDKVRDTEKILRKTVIPSNNPSFSPSGRQGWTMGFTAASSQYLTMSSCPVSSYPLTMSTWMMRPSSTTEQYFFCLYQQFYSDYLTFVHQTSNVIDFNLKADFGSNNTLSSTDTIPDNTWGLVTATVTSPTLRSLFINGTDKQTDTVSVDIGDLDRVRLGCNENAVSFFDGFLSNTAIWNRVLSDIEILELYQNPWILYKPVIPQFFSLPIVTAPAGGQPTQYRFFYIPGSRQWVPGQVGR